MALDIQMFIFARKRPLLLGIDISSAAVKLVELSKALGGRYRVDSHAVVPLPLDAVTDKNIRNVEAVGAAIEAAIRQSGTKLKHAAVAVAGSSVITKIITMSASLREDELEQQIQLEADQYIPYSLDEVRLDFEVLGPSQRGTGMVDVLLAASRKESVEERVAAVELVGLKAEVVDVEAYALENAFSLIASQLPEGKATKTVALIDIGATLMSFNVVENGHISYTRDQGFGGRQLTEEIQRRYGLSYEEAGLAKKLGGLPEDYASDVLEPFKQALTQQVARSLQFYVNATAQSDIDCIVLAGGCASIAGVDQIVENQTGVRTIIANPFIDMSMSSRAKGQILNKDAPAMMTACGLALRSFD